MNERRQWTTAALDLAGGASRRLPAFRGKVRLGRTVASGMARLGADTVRSVTLQTGALVSVDSKGRTEGGPFWDGFYDPEEVRTFVATLGPDDTFVDVGANVGLIALQVSTVRRARGDQGGCVAIEPHPLNAARLRSSIQRAGLDDRVSVIETALGESDGFVDLAAESKTSTSNAGVVGVFGRSGSVHRVPMKRMDSLVEASLLDRVDLIKMDVEGYELPALRGAQRLIEDQRPIIYGEFNNELMPSLGIDFRDVVAFFEPFEYSYFAFGSLFGVVAIADPEPARGNVFLVPNERVEPWLRRLHGLDA